MRKLLCSPWQTLSIPFALVADFETELTQADKSGTQIWLPMVQFAFFFSSVSPACSIPFWPYLYSTSLPPCYLFFLTSKTPLFTLKAETTGVLHLSPPLKKQELFCHCERSRGVLCLFVWVSVLIFFHRLSSFKLDPPKLGPNDAFLKFRLDFSRSHRQTEVSSGGE